MQDSYIAKNLYSKIFLGKEKIHLTCPINNCS